MRDIQQTGRQWQVAKLKTLSRGTRSDKRAEGIMGRVESNRGGWHMRGIALSVACCTQSATVPQQELPEFDSHRRVAEDARALLDA
jgi:hypothetical protein